MKISRMFALIGIAYVVVGGSIVATQFGLSNLIEPPPCNGMPVYTLLGQFTRGVDVAELPENRKQKTEPVVTYIFRLGRSLALWLPDHLKEISAGDMTPLNYSIGGLRCVKYPFAPSAVNSASKESENNVTEEPEITKHDVWN
jgi:hypothetical protein